MDLNVQSILGMIAGTFTHDERIKDLCFLQSIIRLIKSRGNTSDSHWRKILRIRERFKDLTCMAW